MVPRRRSVPGRVAVKTPRPIQPWRRALAAHIALIAVITLGACSKARSRQADPALEALLAVATVAVEAGAPGCPKALAEGDAALFIEEIRGERRVRIVARPRRVAATGGGATWSFPVVRVDASPEAIPWLGRIEEEMEGWRATLSAPTTEGTARLAMEGDAAPEMAPYRAALAGAIGSLELAHAACVGGALTRVPLGTERGEIALQGDKIVARGLLDDATFDAVGGPGGLLLRAPEEGTWSVGILRPAFGAAAP